MIKILKYLGYTFFLPFWWLQLLVPRNKNIWVFGCWYGSRYSDNSRYLFEYVKTQHPTIKPIWLTRSEKIKRKIAEADGLVYTTNSLKGIYYSLRAKNIIVSSGKKDVNYLFGNGARWIQLWHGNPMKKIGLDDKHSPLHSFFQGKVVPTCFPFISEINYDYIVSNSNVFSAKMASAFGVDQSQILETGCPRNDIFYHKRTDAFNADLRSKFSNCKLVYYLPTFRSHNFTKSIFSLPDYSQAQLEAYLEKENIVFVSKGHYVDRVLSKPNNNGVGRLVNLSDDEIDEINFMLKDADLLITDYSGAYFDFLLTQRPIVFAAFDLEEYLSSSRELYFNYHEAIAGPIVKNWKEIFRTLSGVWNNREYEAQIREKNELFNKYHDNQNAKRVYQAISNF